MNQSMPLLGKIVSITYQQNVLTIQGKDANTPVLVVSPVNKHKHTQYKKWLVQA